VIKANHQRVNKPQKEGDRIMSNPGERVRAFRRRRAALRSQTKAALCALYRRGVTTPNGDIGRYLDSAHPIETWRKDEVINSILMLEFPEQFEV
jgi:hypothetical protein